MQCRRGRIPNKWDAVRISAALLWVKDEGLRHPLRDIQKRIFEPFFLLLEAPSQGTGLGLSLVADIIKEHEKHWGNKPCWRRGRRLQFLAHKRPLPACLILISITTKRPASEQKLAHREAALVTC